MYLQLHLLTQQA